MQRYKNHSGGSGVVAYDIGNGSITVQFAGGDRYMYTDESTGPGNVAAMQRLARDGQGLATFISRFVRSMYARKLD